MNLATILDDIRGIRRYATADDIRNVFGDYHNALHWLADFLIGDEKLAEACIIDACTITQTQGPAFHEWLVHWAARATARCALQSQRARIVELAPRYEKNEPVDQGHAPLSAEYFRLLIRHSDVVHARLDVLCRFVLVLRGIAKESWDAVAAELEISPRAVEGAYNVAFDTLGLLERGALAGAMRPDSHIYHDSVLAASID